MYKFAINRPITTLMMVMAIIVFGLMSFRSMPVALFPNIDLPIVTVQTVYPGADPETVESKVTDKIEESVSGIDGIDKLMSTSSEGVSIVTIIFQLDKDITEAANDVRDKIGGVILPSDVEKPLVRKIDASGGSEISLFVTSKGVSDKELMYVADEKLKPKLQRVAGVAEINILGFREKEIRIFTDPFLLNKYGISLTQLNSLIAKENFRAGGGKLIDNKRELIIKSRGDAKSIEELKNIIILPGIKLRDIARVEEGLSDSSTYTTLNGENGVMLEVKKISGFNSLKVIEGVKNVLGDLNAIAGKDFQISVVQDQSEKILVGINNVKFDLILGAFLAIIIVFFFLRNVTATIVSALAIPTSIIGTFAIIDMLGYDLNRLTMIGLTLSIGIFIDDAIVVIENIAKKLEEGMDSFKASFEGIKELAFSVLAISSVLLAVFIPVAFMDGIVGRFFNSFAMTVASGIVISFFIAVMFIPAVAARVVKKGESRFYHATEPLFVKMDRAYVSILKPLIRFKTFTILGAITLLIASGTLMSKIGGDFVPMEDNSEFIVYAKAPLGVSIEQMQKIMKPLDEKFKGDSRVKYTVMSIGYSSAKEIHKGKIYVKLLDVKDREETQAKIVDEYRKLFSNYKNATISVEPVASIDSGQSNAPVQFVVKGADFDTLEKISKDLMDYMGTIQGAVDIDSDYESGKPELKLTIDRIATSKLNISAQDIAGVLNTAFSSDSAISNYEKDGKQYDITLRFSDENRQLIEDLKKIQIKTSSGELVALEGLVTLEETSSAASINRFDRERKILVTANLSGVALGNIVTPVVEKINEFLPAGYSYKITGNAEQMQKTAAAFAAAVFLAIVLIYLILAALYESIIQPFIIMVAMPLSFTGVVLGLYLTNNPFSLFVMIGVILLLGMVGKNAILVVDFANQAIKDGKNIDDAILEAGEKRLRPILMTTIAMIGAMVPLAFGGGAGHESNSPMAIAIIGGLISSTLLTLLVVPAIYKLLYPVDKWLRSWYEKGQV